MRLACAFAILSTALVLLPPQASHGQGSASGWELRVCADPANLPYSNREQEGFENRVAAILADELEAQLTYAWMPLPRRDTDEELMLRTGACDILLGVSDGREPFLTTLSYYRSTAVFVARDDVPFEVASLDDPILQDLQIGVQRGSPADFALVRRDIIDNVHHFFASDPGESIVQQVADGTLDFGIVWGPTAGYHAERLGLPVTLTPVTPEIDMPFLPMIQNISMGVRRTDEDLADLLNRAIAARWDEIQATLESYGVPLVPLVRPAVATAGAGPSAGQGAMRFGMVLPTLTGIDPLFPLGEEFAGEPARLGAELAEETLGPGLDRMLEVLIASAPTAEAAERAARRLVAAHGVPALIGGVGAGQAEALSRVAEESGVLFLNIGDSDDRLRSEICYPATFHVEASDSMYTTVMAAALEHGGHERWFVVQADTPEGERLYDGLARVLAERIPDGREVGRALVAPDQPLFLDVFESVRASGADVLLLLTDAGTQLVFLGQYETSGVGVDVLAFPADLTQTRQYYAALRQDAPLTGAGQRVALWDAALASDGAAELNDRFLSRWGRPMDPPAWAAYAAVKILVDAAASTGSLDPQALAGQLEAPGAAFEVHKGGSVSFRGEDHQLRQPLYLVQLNPDALDLRALAAPVTAIPAGEALPGPAEACRPGS